MENNNQEASQVDEQKKPYINLRTGTDPIGDEVANQIICEFRKGGGGNTKAVWFEADLLRAVLDFIDHNGGSGARFYFGKYPNKDPYGAVLSTSDGNPYNYKNSHTLIVVPTKKVGTRHEDVFKWTDCDNFDDKEIPGDKIVAYNHGELCPPKNDCR